MEAHDPVTSRQLSPALSNYLSQNTRLHVWPLFEFGTLWWRMNNIAVLTFSFRMDCLRNTMIPDYTKVTQPLFYYVCEMQLVHRPWFLERLRHWPETGRHGTSTKGDLCPPGPVAVLSNKPHLCYLKGDIIKCTNLYKTNFCLFVSLICTE